MFRRLHEYINDLKNKFLLFFSKAEIESTQINYTNEQKELFENIEVGEMVWAYMPLTERQLKSVPLGHEMRPYLVLRKDSDHFYAFASTSVYKENRCTYSHYGLNKEIYKNNKNSWILLNKVYKIPVENIIDKLCSINNDDLNRIHHRLLVRKEKFDLKEYNYFNANNRLYKGDLIKCGNKLFYIYNSDSDYSYGYQVFRKNKLKGQLIYIDKFKYFIKFDMTKKFNSHKFNGVIIDIANGCERVHIDKLIKEEKVNKKIDTPKIKNKKKVIDESTPFEVGNIYENLSGSKFVFICNYKGTNYGADLFEIDEDMILKALSDIKGYRCIGKCREKEFDTIMENVLISENVSDKIQKSILGDDVIETEVILNTINRSVENYYG